MASTNNLEYARSTENKIHFLLFNTYSYPHFCIHLKFINLFYSSKSQSGCVGGCLLSVCRKETDCLLNSANANKLEKLKSDFLEMNMVDDAIVA